jgi:hypothetical protein
MELRNRFNFSNNVNHVNRKENVNNKLKDKNHDNKANNIFKNISYILFMIIGFVICFMVSKYYTNYLKQSHENTLWFSKIKVLS